MFVPLTVTNLESSVFRFPNLSQTDPWWLSELNMWCSWFNPNKNVNPFWLVVFPGCFCPFWGQRSEYCVAYSFLAPNISTNTVWFVLICSALLTVGARGSVVVEAQCCKPEGRGFKSRWGGFF
jgi:hypothetical protein